VDSVFFRPRKRARTSVLSEITTSTLVRDLFEPIEEGQLRLGERCRMKVPDATERIYRVHAATPENLFNSNTPLQPRQSTFTLLPLVWKDLNELEAVQAIVNGQSLLALGMPGVRKTTICRKFHENLQSLQKKTAMVSKPHAASTRAGGCTADHYFRT
jgi:hypothetical protein